MQNRALIEDAAKVAQQLLETSEPNPKEVFEPKYNGLVGTTRTIVAEEGTLALWNGLSAGLQR